MVKDLFFPNHISQVMRALKLNQAGLSKAIGVSSGVVSEFANGSREPSKGFLFGLSKLGVSLDWFLTGEGEMFLPKEPASPPPANPEDDGFRQAVPDVYGLYQENKRLKEEGSGESCRVCKIVNRLEEPRAIKVEGYAESQLAEQEEEKAEKTREPSPSYTSDPPPSLYSVASETPPPDPSLPLYTGAAAGQPQETFNLGERITVPAERLKAAETEYFAFRVNGTSMVNADIPDGCIAVFRKDRPLRSGNIYLFRNTTEYTIKRYKEDCKGAGRLLYDDGTGREIDLGECEWDVVGEFCFVG